MERVRALLDEAVATGVATAAQLAVAIPGRPAWRHAVGSGWPGGPPVDHDTPFDLASVTKVFTTLAVGHVLGVDLDRPIGDWLPAAAGDRTLRELLGHRSGLRPWAPWFLAGTPHAVREAVLAERPGPADRRAYSDAGFLLLGWAVEEGAGASLDAIATALVGGLGLRFHPLPGEVPPAPVTGAWRPREPAPGQEGRYTVPPQVPLLVPGEVDDDNAWALGGVAGHAGLFGAATALAELGAWILEDLHGAGHLLPADRLAELVAPDAPALLPVRGLGLDRPAAEGSAAGRHLGRGPLGAIGHLGFTGTSLWVDLDAGVSIALCTNRTFPTRANTEAIRRLRPAVHDAVAEALGLA
ncbi:MAG: beta-lactamase family protein [Alphaproteobacteria bacterium]|nr:beta-lactamase family protein [Alphaproteobacteria bacterium]